MRPLVVSGKDALQFARVVLCVAAGEVFRRTAADAIVLGRAAQLDDGAGVHIVQQEVPRRARLVPAGFAVHDKGSLDGHTCERIRHQLRRLRAECTDQLVGWRGRIG